MAPVRYATRDDVLVALDLPESARLSAAVDRALDAASRAVEAVCGGRYFHPQLDTRDLVPVGWSLSDRALTAWRVHLTGLAEATALTAVTLDGAAVDFWLGPQTPGTAEGREPYTYLDLDGVSGTVLGLTGTFGACSATTAATTLAGALSGGAGQLAVADSARVSPGALLKVDSEWLNVTGRTQLATGQALTVALAESTADVLIQTADPTVLGVGEVLTIGAERMRVEDVTGAGAIVSRAWAGSVLATHGIGAAVYAPRTLTVERAQCGSTAASHTDGAAVRVHTPPGLVRDLAIAETLNRLAQESSSYARTIGSAEAMRNASGRGLVELREQVRVAHGRGVRTAAI